MGNQTTGATLEAKALLIVITSRPISCFGSSSDLSSPASTSEPVSSCRLPLHLKTAASLPLHRSSLDVDSALDSSAGSSWDQSSDGERPALSALAMVICPQPIFQAAHRVYSSNPATSFRSTS